VSSGGVSPKQAIALGAGYQVPFAERVKSEVGMPVIAVGLITEPRQAEEIIAKGQADAVSLARAILYDPRWPWHAAAELGAQVKAPHQYWRSQPREFKDLFENAASGRVDRRLRPMAATASAAMPLVETTPGCRRTRCTHRAFSPARSFARVKF
jgi:tRNA-dihydrouridine synthase